MDLSELFRDGYDNPDLSDYTLTIVFDSDKNIIKVNSLLLAAHSKYFNSMMTNNMEEKSTKQIEFKAESIDEYNALNAVIKLFYGHDIKEIKNENILDMLAVANKLQANYIFNKLSKALKVNSIDICNKILGVLFSKDIDHSLYEVVEQEASKFLLKTFSKFDDILCDILDIEDFMNLNIYSLCSLLADEEISASNENMVYLAVREWIMRSKFSKEMSLEETAEDHKDMIRQLFSCIRFEYLTTDFMFNIVKNDIVISKLPVDIQEELGKKVSDAIFYKLMIPQCKNVPPKKLFPDVEPKRLRYTSKTTQTFVHTIDITNLLENTYINETINFQGYDFILQFGNINDNLSIFLKINPEKSFLHDTFIFMVNVFFLVEHVEIIKYKILGNDHSPTIFNKNNTMIGSFNYLPPITTLKTDQLFVKDNKLTIRCELEYNNY